MGIQVNNILIFANNHFATTEKNAIRLAKIMIKDRKHFISTHFLKFNCAQIKLNSNRIVFTEKSYVWEIFLVINYFADFISCKGITKKELSPKE